MLPAWRAACLAYRQARREGHGDEVGFRAAVVALLKVRPDLTEEEAGRQVTRAISYASVQHADWFWDGVGKG